MTAPHLALRGYAELMLGMSEGGSQKLATSGSPYDSAANEGRRRWRQQQQEQK